MLEDMSKNPVHWSDSQHDKPGFPGLDAQFQKLRETASRHTMASHCLQTNWETMLKTVNYTDRSEWSKHLCEHYANKHEHTNQQGYAKYVIHTKNGEKTGNGDHVVYLQYARDMMLVDNDGLIFSLVNVSCRSCLYCAAHITP